MIRHEEAQRAEFVDDLLRGDADVSRLVQRAQRSASISASRTASRWSPCAMATAHPTVRRSCWSVPRSTGSATVRCWSPRRTAGWLSSFPARSPDSALSQGGNVGATLLQELRRRQLHGNWRVAAGRSFPGAYGIARSYEEALEALTFAERLGLDTDVVHARDLLVYRVLGRDQAAIVDLVRDVLTPLNQVRGGARCYWRRCGSTSTQERSRPRPPGGCTSRSARSPTAWPGWPSWAVTRFPTRPAIRAGARPWNSSERRE